MATLTRTLSIEEASAHVAKMGGMTVSRIWLGHAAALFVELGELRPHEFHESLRGERTIMLDTDWRSGIAGFEVGDRNDGEAEIERYLQPLLNQAVREIHIDPDLSLTIDFESGQWIRSPAVEDHDSSWTLFLGDGRWITVEEGRLCIQRGVESHDSGETV